LIHWSALLKIEKHAKISKLEYIRDHPKLAELRPSLNFTALTACSHDVFGPRAQHHIPVQIFNHAQTDGYEAEPFLPK